MSDESATRPSLRPARWRPLLLSAALPLLLLAPFADKAYHIDDPLYLWAAKQIHTDPFDYYGAIVNKWGTDQPLSEVMVIPPGYPFFLALVALLFGWGEVPMHLAMTLWASALAVGIHLVASRLCSRPGLASVLAILTPAFLISSTTVMTDIPMIALFVWAVYLWLIGLDRNRHALLFASGLCMGLSMLFKYSGFTVVPLLLAYSILARRRPGLWALQLLIPVVMLGAYQYVEYRLYGKPQLGYSFKYVQSDYSDSIVPDWLQPFVGITFVGGSFASIALFAPLLWGRRVLLSAAAATAALTGLVYAFSDTLLYTTRLSPALTFALSAQDALWFVGGSLVLLMAIADLWRARNKDSVLLFLWVFGSFAFAALINWSINARALLPLLAPIAILAVRRLDRVDEFTLRQRLACAGLLVASAALAAVLTLADYKQANIARSAAHTFIADDRVYPHQYYFEDHWGFQYYMEEGGVPYLDEAALREHDRIVAPLWGSVDVAYNPDKTRRVPGAELKRHGLRWVTTMHPALCAGFYAHTRGALPFAFGPVPPEEYAVFEVGHYEQR